MDTYLLTRIHHHKQWVIQPKERNDQWLRDMLAKPDPSTFQILPDS